MMKVMMMNEYFVTQKIKIKITVQNLKNLNFKIIKIYKRFEYLKKGRNS